MAFEHENTPYGSYGEFEPVPADFDWDEYYVQQEAEMAKYDAERAEWEAEAAAAYWDDDPNPYHGDYSEM